MLLFVKFISAISESTDTWSCSPTGVEGYFPLFKNSFNVLSLLPLAVIVYGIIYFGAVFRAGY